MTTNSSREPHNSFSNPSLQPQKGDKTTRATTQSLAWGVDLIERLIVVLAVLLLTLAVLLQMREAARALWHGFTGNYTGTQLTMALAQALLALMVAEIIGTVGTFLREGGFNPVSFLVIGIIASVRRLLVISAEAAELFSHGVEIHTSMLVELGLLIVSVAVFAWAIRYLQGSVVLKQ